MGIDWTRVIELCFGYFGGVTGLVGTSVYLGKSVIPHWLNKETERYKAELRVQGDIAVEQVRSETKAQQDRSLEVLRAEIRIVTAEHEVRYARLVERRATVIAELYKHLVDAEVQFQYLMSPFKQVSQRPDEEFKAAVQRDEAERRLAAGKAGDTFNDYFRQNRIFFSPEMCAIIDEVQAKQRAAWSDYRKHEAHREHLTPEMAEKRDDAQLRAWFAVGGDLPKIRARLEAEFRTLLGVGVAAPSVLAATSNKDAPAGVYLPATTVS